MSIMKILTKPCSACRRSDAPFFAHEIHDSNRHVCVDCRDPKMKIDRMSSIGDLRAGDRRHLGRDPKEA